MSSSPALQRFFGRSYGQVRENRKKESFNPFRFRPGWCVGVGLLVTGLGGGGGALWSIVTHYAAHHPYFALQDIEVSSDGRLSVEQIRRWSGLKHGMNLWEVNPQHVEKRLHAQAWVQTADVRREFPQRVHVTVTSRRPVAIILRKPFTYLDDTGTYFVVQEGGDDIDLPYVSGLEHISLDTPASRAVLAEIVHLLSLVHLWREPISEIHWDPRRGYTLFLMGRQVSILLGKETTPEKFTQLRSVLEIWPVGRPAVLFDARFAHQVVVRPEANSRGHGRTQDPTRRPL
jgi:cell division septal protein FtsQ